MRLEKHQVLEDRDIEQTVIKIENFKECLYIETLLYSIIPEIFQECVYSGYSHDRFSLIADDLIGLPKIILKMAIEDIQNTSTIFDSDRKITNYNPLLSLGDAIKLYVTGMRNKYNRNGFLYICEDGGYMIERIDPEMIFESEEIKGIEGYELNLKNFSDSVFFVH